MPRLCNMSCFQYDLEGGLTSFMLRQLLIAVKEGQPLSVVVGTNHAHATDLCRRFCRMLEYEHWTWRRTFWWRMSNNEVEYNDCKIVFVAASEIDRIRGLRGAGYFVDHNADSKAHNMLAEAGLV